VASAFDDFARAFEAFKEANDERLGQIETRLSTDALTEEKLARIDGALDDAKRRIDRLSLDRARPPLGTDTPRDPLLHEHKAAFRAYMRSGEASGLKRLEEKALSAGSGPDGGYLVPDTVEREVLRRLANVSPIRAVASVRVISGGQYKARLLDGGRGLGLGRRNRGAAAEREPDARRDELSRHGTLRHAGGDPDASGRRGRGRGPVDRGRGRDRVRGAGERRLRERRRGQQAEGLPRLAHRRQRLLELGQLGYLATGGAAFPATNPSDILVELVYALRAGYRQNAAFVMNRKTQGLVRRFKDTNGAYLWQPPASAGAPATLMGFPVVEAEDMPDVAANALAVAFGDFRRGYLVVDRAGVRVLRDPYSAKPYVLFYTTKRVGGGVQDYDAIKLLKFAAS
jgi:predicted phage gp36 major capsid-like protein